ncbi:MAG: dTDP-4-dehydrorhamnose reductase [Actinobacteria bacterium]|nr:dTDP-4-dehydrorhamnose reductase [Actinomycetota bacterium]MCA1719943.1 dTDP-4-dehydrorhamnose reductase [Actinomycetota bacterium]
MATALLVTGAGGQLGSDLLDQVRSTREVFARGLTRKDLDVRDPFAVDDMLLGWQRIVRSDSPDHRLVVVNCTAYTAVDAAEDDEETAYAVNAAAPALLATACAKVGARLVHVSTDYVFPGDGTRPYEVDDPTGPTGAYGRTKLAGEQAVREILPAASHVVRTAWLYGATGQNFVKTMARLEGERETVSVVDDQRGSPTWSRDLAQGLLALATSDVPAGVLHAINAGDTTWHGFTRAIFEELGADPGRVLSTTSDAYPRPAPRPAYSVLSPRSWNDAGLPPLQPWREALAEAFRTSGGAFRP